MSIGQDKKKILSIKFLIFSYPSVATLVLFWMLKRTISLKQIETILLRNYYV